jgi:hypothetical protein
MIHVPLLVFFDQELCQYESWCENVLVSLYFVLLCVRERRWRGVACFDIKTKSSLDYR